jgi:hypothetical protein
MCQSTSQTRPGHADSAAVNEVTQKFLLIKSSANGKKIALCNFMLTYLHEFVSVLIAQLMQDEDGTAQVH